ncbi:MAG: hypothetical protein ACOZF0_14795 [Thermodesulfobacteriota bacterium]
MDTEALPDFHGKIVVFYISNAPDSLQDGAVLEYISFKQFGGKLFVVGRVPEIDAENGDWIANLQGGIAWDAVTSYLIFDSRENYLSRMGLTKTPLIQRLFARIFN